MKTNLFKLVLVAIFALSANAALWSGYAKIAKKQVDRAKAVTEILDTLQESNPELFYKNFGDSKVHYLNKETMVTKYIGSDVEKGINNKPMTYQKVSDKQYKICNAVGVRGSRVPPGEKADFVIKMFKNNPTLPVFAKYNSAEDCLYVYYKPTYIRWVEENKKDKKIPEDKINYETDKNGCIKEVFASKADLISKTSGADYDVLKCAYARDEKDATKVNKYYWSGSEWLLWKTGEDIDLDKLAELVKEKLKGQIGGGDGGDKDIETAGYLKVVVKGMESDCIPSILNLQCGKSLTIKTRYFAATPSLGAMLFYAGMPQTYLLGGAQGASTTFLSYLQIKFDPAAEKYRLYVHEEDNPGYVRGAYGTYSYQLQTTRNYNFGIKENFSKKISIYTLKGSGRSTYPVYYDLTISYRYKGNNNAQYCLDFEPYNGMGWNSFNGYFNIFNAQNKVLLHFDKDDSKYNNPKYCADIQYIPR